MFRRKPRRGFFCLSQAACMRGVDTCTCHTVLHESRDEMREAKAHKPSKKDDDRRGRECRFLLPSLFAKDNEQQKTQFKNLE